MAYGGFEKDRGCLKYRCPARHYGFECAGADECPVGFAVRILLAEDRHIFTPCARSSYAWKRLYRKRTAVERVNSRLDVSFGFECHFIWGLEKMKLRCGQAMCVMLAIHGSGEGQEEFAGEAQEPCEGSCLYYPLTSNRSVDCPSESWAGEVRLFFDLPLPGIKVSFFKRPYYCKLNDQIEDKADPDRDADTTQDIHKTRQYDRQQYAHNRDQ